MKKAITIFRGVWTCSSSDSGHLYTYATTKGAAGDRRLLPDMYKYRSTLASVTRLIIPLTPKALVQWMNTYVPE